MRSSIRRSGRRSRRPSKPGAARMTRERLWRKLRLRDWTLSSERNSEIERIHKIFFAKVHFILDNSKYFVLSSICTNRERCAARSGTGFCKEFGLQPCFTVREEVCLGQLANSKWQLAGPLCDRRAKS